MTTFGVGTATSPGGPLVTADVYPRGLGAFCAEQKVLPNTLAKMSGTKLDNLLMDYVWGKE
jgi:hypothetical protein